MQTILSPNSHFVTSNDRGLHEKLERNQPLKVVALGDS
ncbi:MAG: hypothetical protein RLZZ574_2818, partial [Cyanobacteriota bacterium]